MMSVHVSARYVVGRFLVLQIIWGLISTRHARFSDFSFGPRAAARYMLQLAIFRASCHIGHNPADSFMVYLLLFSQVITVATDLLA